MSCQAEPGIEPGPSALKVSALPSEQRGRTALYSPLTTYPGKGSDIIIIIV